MECPECSHSTFFDRTACPKCGHVFSSPQAAVATAREPRQAARSRLYLVHLLNALGLLAFILFPLAWGGSREERYRLLLVLVVPFGFLVMSVFVYSLIKTVSLRPPRKKAIALTLLLFPGSLLPVLGILGYIGFAVYAFVDYRAQMSGWS